MKLQVNQRGAWRDVIEFDETVAPHIQRAVIPLAREIGDRATWRITTDSRTAIAYLNWPSFNWQRR